MARKNNSPGARNPEKYEQAYALFIRGCSQGEICERAGVSTATYQQWKREGVWEDKRATKHISVDSLISKTLVKINEILEENDFNADAFSKAVSQLKQFKRGLTIDDKIGVLMDYGDWLIYEGSAHGADTDFIKRTTHFQDMYIIQGKNGKN